ncbi:hypothetical protein F5148DRAFT_1160552 [Russula earlei]|uniref:Uncharacterized protein n=1 Tax=Russula earlei TaxID=71964 RepID=A0ACC0UMR9_9AGAM|nr:hypothetical protein F5148DRAFT_1160552 [Russula earlei]
MGPFSRTKDAHCYNPYSSPFHLTLTLVQSPSGPTPCSESDLVEQAFTLVNMSSIPPPLSRRRSTPSILRCLDTPSPPSSWSSLDDNLIACCQAGSIPFILHAGIGDLSNTIDATSSGYLSDQDKGGSHTHIYHESPNQGSGNACIKAQEETPETGSPHQAMPMPPPQSTTNSPIAKFVRMSQPNSPSTPESSPQRPRYVVYKDFVHAKSEYSDPLDPSGTQRTSPERTQASSETGEPWRPSGPKGSSGRRRNCSTSTIDSGSSSRSNPQLLPHGAKRILENIGIGTVRFPLLPISLSWLESITLEVMIDQEGFRMIKPVFKLAGYSCPTQSEVFSLGVHLVSATADFMPLQRKSFAFHHSTLDTPPVLRRLMVNGDESRDYLSRQAYLILKANGPYTVHGTEPVQPPRLFPAEERPVAAWKFDYLVGDRRTEAGRTIPGEKTLTPLSFSCSPALLQPAQAKKIRVVQVVKKSVTAKLMSTKVEPPLPPSHCTALRSAALLEDIAVQYTQSNPLQDTIGTSPVDSAHPNFHSHDGTP